MFMGDFKALGINDVLQRKVCSYGWHQPTPIQRAAIPQVLSGKDVVGIAETGSGKTAAFLLPILQLWTDCGRPKGSTLILAPTRELAQQIAVEAERLGSASDCGSDLDNLRVICLIGGEDMVQQTLQIAWNRHHMIVATPGRLADHIRQSESFASQQLSHLLHLVFDEADRMLSLDFADDIDCLLRLFQVPTRREGKPGRKRRRRKRALLESSDRNDRVTNHRIAGEKAKFAHPQTQLYSATMTKDLAKLRRAALSPDAVVVTSKPARSLETVPDVQVSQLTTGAAGGERHHLTSTRSVGFPTGLQHYYLPLCLSDKLAVLDWILDHGDSLSSMLKMPVPAPSDHQSTEEAVQRIIVFCKRCQETRLVTAFLLERGHLAIGLTGRMKQPERKEALHEFLLGRVSILVATDVASRGLDIPNVALVVNYSVPLSEKTYRHRVGRTARAGQPGVAVTLVTRDMAADFIDLEAKLSPHLVFPAGANQKTAGQGMPRWPIPLPGKNAMLLRSRLVDEARARAAKAIRTEDLERRRLQATDSDSESLDGQSIDLSSAEEQPDWKSSHEETRQGDDREQETDSSTASHHDSADPHQLVTSGLAGIRAARAHWRKTSREKAERRRKRAEASDASRSAAAQGWGLRYTLNTVESAMLDENDEAGGKDGEEHLRFEEPLKAKYLKAKQIKRR